MKQKMKKVNTLETKKCQRQVCCSNAILWYYIRGHP